MAEHAVDPFVFVAATRYAIRRTLTIASEMVAHEVRLHAALIAREPGAATAIVREVEDFVATFDALDAGQTAEELLAIKDRWRDAAAAVAAAALQRDRNGTAASGARQ